MRRPHMLALAIVAFAGIAFAENLPTEVPGKPDPARVTAGSYAVDPAHTQLAFTVMHLGFNPYHGLFGDITGTLELDPAKPDAAKLSIDIPMAGITTTSADLDTHLRTPDFFDAARFPSAHFESTSVTASGTSATIAGNLTIKGITKPIVLEAHFTGAGKGMVNGAETIGFAATTTVRRSDFGVNYGIPLVSDEVPLEITVAFEKRAA